MRDEKTNLGQIICPLSLRPYLPLSIYLFISVTTCTKKHTLYTIYFTIDIYIKNRWCNILRGPHEQMYTGAHQHSLDCKVEWPYRGKHYKIQLECICLTHLIANLDTIDDRDFTKKNTTLKTWGRIKMKINFTITVCTVANSVGTIYREPSDCLSMNLNFIICVSATWSWLATRCKYSTIRRWTTLEWLVFFQLVFKENSRVQTNVGWNGKLQRKRSYLHTLPITNEGDWARTKKRNRLAYIFFS